jgi:hypothetical protein
MTRTITRMFDNRADAEAAVSQLEAMGVRPDDMSIVAHSGRTAMGEDRSFARKDSYGDGRSDVAEGAGKGAAAGGALGVAAGWLGATLIGAASGAVVGAGTGGLLGALKDAGVDDEDAHVFAEGVKRGGAIVCVRADEGRAPAIQQALDLNSVEPRSRRELYRKEGWTRFEDAPMP